ncbi:MAG TPA: hypothetical protein VJ246_02555 [Patescibacteria group bacterium]|nr:hypothetical protein [Patescibacteria group bacterium]
MTSTEADSRKRSPDRSRSFLSERTRFFVRLFFALLIPSVAAAGWWFSNQDFCTTKNTVDGATPRISFEKRCAIDFGLGELKNVSRYTSASPDGDGISYGQTLLRGSLRKRWRSGGETISVAVSSSFSRRGSGNIESRTILVNGHPISSAKDLLAALDIVEDLELPAGEK